MNAATMVALGYMETTERPEPVPMTGYVPAQSTMPDYTCKTYGMSYTCTTMRVYDHKKTMRVYDGISTERDLEEYKGNVHVEDEQPEAQTVKQIKAELDHDITETIREMEKAEDERPIRDIQRALFVGLIVLGFICDYRIINWLLSLWK